MFCWTFGPVSAGKTKSDSVSLNFIFYSQKQKLTDATFPGMTLNLKKKVKSKAPNGTERFFRGGRLECTMQNVADALGEVRSEIRF